MNLRGGQKQVTIDPNKARDKEVIAAGTPTSGLIARVELLQLPRIAKKNPLASPSKPTNFGGRRHKKIYPAVKIHPGKFGENFPPFWAGKGDPPAQKNLSGCKNTSWKI